MWRNNIGTMTKGSLSCFWHYRNHPLYGLSEYSNYIKKLYDCYFADYPIEYAAECGYGRALSTLLKCICEEDAAHEEEAANTAILYQNKKCVKILLSFVKWNYSFLNTAVMTNNSQIIDLCISRYKPSIRDINKALCEAAWYGALHSAKSLCDHYNANVEYHNFKPIRIAARSNKRKMIQYLSSQL